MIISISTNRHVPPGTHALAAGETMVPCVPGRLIVSPSCAPYFDVQDVIIARMSWISGERTPADVFTWHACQSCGKENSVGGAEIDWGDFVLEPGMKITVCVMNRDRTDREFGAVLETHAYDSVASRVELALRTVEIAHLAERAADMLEAPDASWPDTARVAARLLRSGLPKKRIKP